MLDRGEVLLGIINLNKPAGKTSHDMVSFVRRTLGLKRVGHAGTLDPDATGVLPVLVGKATSLSDLLTEKVKTYVATVRIGIETDTYDISGQVTNRSDVRPSDDEICEMAKSFLGEISQVPPMYSALKKDGVRLYELARQGVEVEREERECEIYCLEVEEISENEFSLYTECSSGTYIRSLIYDIGEVLGVGATMTSLNRNFACGISEDECITLQELENFRDNNELEKVVISVDKILSEYPKINVTKPQGVRFKNGGELLKNRLKGEVP